MKKPVPFSLTFSAEANQSIADAGDWLSGISASAAHRFAVVLPAELADLCARWGQGFHPLPDEAATLFFSHPVFVLTVRMRQQRRRRSSAGVWHVLYDVMDVDGDGVPDTLRILTVRHGAARPLSVEDNDEP
jgi:hypothetical protein